MGPASATGRSMPDDQRHDDLRGGVVSDVPGMDSPAGDTPVTLDGDTTTYDVAELVGMLGASH